MVRPPARGRRRDWGRALEEGRKAPNWKLQLPRDYSETSARPAARAPRPRGVEGARARAITPPLPINCLRD
ncbi:hypothetical protein EVAR_31744_1 [Eumeta japonica]|uniref:Uncharacterized protein n=1 Tax=Eumeta variegata TaxID=151549 RepID=A0A4C1W4M7_EUMVA|nr:hypothetical protein EVAR_31744_1 [Eumeta japonica]